MEKFVFKILKRIILGLRFYETPFKRNLYKKIFKKQKNLNQFLQKKKIENGYLKISRLEIEKIPFYNETIYTAEKLILNKSVSSGTKKYLRDILPKQDNDKYIKVFLNFVLNEYFIHLIQNYIDDTPLLTELKLLHSPANLEDEHSGSQLYHRDFDDDKIIKIFFYLVDVDENTGPLEIINFDKSKEVTTKIKNAYSIHSDKIIESMIASEKDKVSCIGNKGDCYLVDTSSCFHRGSRNSTKDRFILYANFSSRSSYRFPPIFKYSKNVEIMSFHSPLNKYCNLLDSNKKKYLLNY